MPTSRTTSTQWMRGVAQALAGQGLDVPALFAAAGLSLELLQHPERRYPTERIARLWTLAAQASGQHGIGLAHRGAPQPGIFDVVGYAMMSAPTVQAALERLTRYLRIVSDAATVTLEPVPQACWVRLEVSSGALPTPPQRYQYDLSALLGFLGWISGRELTPIVAAMAHAPPPDPAAYHAALRCTVRFAAPFYGLLFNAADLALPLPASNPELADLHERLAGARLLRLQRGGVALRAQDVLAPLLPDGEPRRARVAALLAMSERTFQRRLAAQGTHFSALVDATRKELAQHYLVQPEVSLMQVSYLLGFADQSNLFRACMRWFGRAPGRYRLERQASA